MFARRQHGDDDVSAFDRANCTVGDRRTVRFGLLARGSHQIERDDLVASLDQIGRHRAAHVAEADECDACHVSLRLRRFYFALSNTSSSAPTLAKYGATISGITSSIRGG